MSFRGAYFILDGQEQDICRNIDIKKPLWAVIDIYGNVKGMSRLTNEEQGAIIRRLIASYAV